MLTNLTTNLLDVFQSGWAFLDQDQRIVEFNKRFLEYQNIASSIQGVLIDEVLPESVGLTDVLKKMMKGGQISFILPHVEKESDSKNSRYFNLIFMSTQIPERPLLVLIIDDTDNAVLNQKIQQQSFELRLMRSLLNSKRATKTYNLIGSSKPINQIKILVQKLGLVPQTTVLIQGETGTGKNLVARMIHLAADGSEKPFVEFNCAAVPDSLLESELFGHEKGAFTNAMAQRKGLLEDANGGTLFLDEIGDIPLQLQAKLLSVLESKKYRRLGSNKEVDVRFRLIVATHRDLQSMVKEGTFREDLFYRINVATVFCPPLRDMDDDIVQIARHFIDIYGKEFGKTIQGLSPAAEVMLKEYNWPGNVRELRNVIERAMIFAENQNLDTEDMQLPLHSDKRRSMDVLSLPNEGLSFEKLEKQLLKQAMEHARGNQSQAARLLHMSRDTFCYRLEKHGIIKEPGSDHAIK